MATSPPTPVPVLHPDHVLPVRRFTPRLLGRRTAPPSLGQRLRGVLPLRYPSDPLDPSTDALTGLGSQMGFLDALENRAREFERGGVPYSLALIDIDHLGLLNQRRGWVAGDQLLRRLAQVSRSLSHVGVRTFRIGGDEFGVVLSGAGPDEAVRYLYRLLDALRESSGDEPQATFSAAVAAVPSTAPVPELAYRQAAAALPDVKRNGRCGVAIFEPTRHPMPAPADRSMTELIDSAVAGRSLRPVFQPIFDLRTGHVLGYEGLARTDAGGAGRGTRELFAAADASGRIVELDLACIETIVSGARAIRTDRLLTINLSPRTLAGREFEPTWLLQSLVRAGISPARVIVELSDAEPVDDLGRLQRAFAELHRFGIRLAADDVSADDPTRRLLNHVPFDVVKIDLSQFWEGAWSGPRLAGLRDTALNRHARVVVEGVETSEQFVAVRDLEIGAGQGYLLGRPEPAVVDRVVDLHRLEFEATIAARAPAPIAPVDDEPRDDMLLARLALLVPSARGDSGMVGEVA